MKPIDSTDTAATGALTPSVLPPLAFVQKALRLTTEHLARELAQPSPRAPDWSEHEWCIARAAASLHGISPLLAGCLRWHGPPGWRQFLEQQRTHTAARYAQIQTLLGQLEARSVASGVPFVALKGVALHRLGLYQPGDRPMADLDLLAATADDESRIAVLLKELGLRESATTWKERVFEPAIVPQAAAFGEHAGNALKVDLHVKIQEILPRRAVEITRLLVPAAPVAGLNAYPSHAALMIHLLLHASGAIVFRVLRIVQVHDLALLCFRMSPADWAEVLQYGERHELWWALAPLRLLERYYGCVPEPLLSAVEASCGRGLRNVCRRQLASDVSFSDMRRGLFPGIEWTRSSMDRMAYVADRALLSARTALRAGVPRNPQAPITTNYGFHAGRRGKLYWLGLWPARPATLNAVRAALAQPC
jgi:hypothetical protein